MRSIVGADKIAVAMQDCPIAVNHKRRQMAGKNRPADGFDRQVSVPEQPFDRK